MQLAVIHSLSEVIALKDERNGLLVNSASHVPLFSVPGWVFIEMDQ
jgi:hypothetical protein